MAGASLQPVRGTHDLYGDDLAKHKHIVQTAYEIAVRFGYEGMATPIFEHTAVFKRTLGETTDIVGKEMYTFTDRGGEEITLRPEGTASVIRSIISNGMTQSLPLKFMYDGPMLRYERPQKGRLRQFHQVGAEFLGAANPLADVETIALGAQILKALGLLAQTTLEINTLGDAHSRQAFRQAIVSYLTPLQAQLSEDSQTRLTRNPLRILDSKDAGDREILVNAPRFSEYLSAESKDFFERACQGLTDLGIAFQHSHHLVRGLDYYCHTAFEFTTTTLGAQGTVLAGGRYDSLVEQMGGPATPGIGWALGIERLALMLDKAPTAPRPISIVPVGDDTLSEAFALAMMMRENGVIVDFTFSGNMNKRMKRADKLKARAAIILGSDEVKNQVVTIRNLDSGTQDQVPWDQITSFLK